MQLNLICDILITQQPTTDFPNRNKSVRFNFVNYVETLDGWSNLTSTAKVIFPQKLYFKDGDTGKKVSWFQQGLVSEPNTVPLVLRGDQISISLGYSYFDNNNIQQFLSPKRFDGFISKIYNRMPIELDCEDNMWKLKQIPAPNKVFKSSEYDVEKMITEMLKGTDFTVVTGVRTRQSVKTNVGDFRTHNETVAQVLERLKKDYMIHSYFQGKELRCSGIVYYPEDQRQRVFKFQQNIISDSLEYRRKDDVKIAIKAISVFEYLTGETTPSGKPAKKKKRVSVTVPENPGDAEIRTIYFYPTGNTIAEITQNLKDLANQRLGRIYYEGFYGSFTTWGLPETRHGDLIVIQDNVLPERNGTYLCKSVRNSFGMGGYRQEIELDIRVDKIPESELANGL